MLPMCKRLFTPLLTLAVLMFSFTALAQGQVKWKRQKINESNEAWNIDLEFHLKKAPDIAIVPVRFEFTPEVYYERSLVDGKEEPVVNRMPLTDRQPIVSTQDVGFMNPGTGKYESRTRFAFKITREEGFEAGEYKVVLEDKRSGKKMGSPVHLTLEGENPVIDRRSISFDPSKKRKEKEPTAEEKAAAEDPPDPDSEEFWAGGPQGDDDPNERPLPPPAHMQERPCACRVPGGNSHRSSLPQLLGIGFAAVLALRLRRRA
jgi:hypothetical protein